jgi:hypothetical protein
MSLDKWNSKESFQGIDQFLKLFPIFTSERVKLVFVAQHTHKEIYVRFVLLTLSDFIDMSTRYNVAQLLKVN